MVLILDKHWTENTWNFIYLMPSDNDDNDIVYYANKWT